MRNPNRIRELLDLVNRIWLNDPDLRFNQLIYNLQSGYSHSNGEVGKITEPEVDGFARVGFDLFNLEDDLFLEYLRTVADGSRE